MNEQNASQQIAQFLKLKKLPFVYDENCDIFEILIGDEINPTIQLEYSDNRDLDEIYLSFWFNEFVETGEYNNVEDIEDNLFQIVDHAKNYTKCVSKIRKKLEQIEEICEEYDLDINDFVTIHLE